MISECNDPRLALTRFAVEATSFEYSSLWGKHKDNPDILWNESNGGPLLTLGFINKRPICVELRWIIINGHYVMLYEATSQLVDYVMIEAWLKENNWKSTDAQNFHNCIHDMNDLEPIEFKKVDRPDEYQVTFSKDQWTVIVAEQQIIIHELNFRGIYLVDESSPAFTLNFFTRDPKNLNFAKMILRKYFIQGKNNET